MGRKSEFRQKRVDHSASDRPQVVAGVEADEGGGMARRKQTVDALRRELPDSTKNETGRTDGLLVLDVVAVDERTTSSGHRALSRGAARRKRKFPAGLAGRTMWTRGTRPPAKAQQKSVLARAAPKRTAVCLSTSRRFLAGTSSPSAASPADDLPQTERAPRRPRRPLALPFAS